MKKSIIPVIFLLLISQNYSQLTLTSSINPVAGNTQMIVNSDTNGITQGNAGPNQTWNFTSLVRRDSSLLSWVSSSSTPYAGQFPTSNVASTNDNSNYNYFTTSAANLITNGTAGPVAVIPYSNPELFMQYPFTYNSSFSDVFAANYLLGGIPTVRTGTITVTGDAWGTINLQFGSFTNALRVKYVISTKDSSNPGTPIVIITNLTSYVWFVPGRKFPVFEIVYTDITINDEPQAPVKSIDYNSNSTPIGIRPISNEIPREFSLYQNYPNPFNPVTKIKFSISAGSFANGGLRTDIVRLAVFDILGRQIAVLVNNQLQPGTYEVDWNASNYPSGVYIYRIAAGEFVEAKRMVLVK